MRSIALVNLLNRSLRNRNVILTSALLIGLVWGKGARWTEPLTLPALAIVMTLSTIGLPASTFRSYRNLLAPAGIGILMNYFVLGIALLALNAMLVHEEALRMGFILIAVVPPAVAVIPFTFFLKGDETLSQIGTTGAYLGALIILPARALLFFGPGFVDATKLAVILLELILFPVLVSRLLLRIGWAPRLYPIRGPITNWSFFLLTYTIVGLNRDLILGHPSLFFRSLSLPWQAPSSWDGESRKSGPFSVYGMRY